VVKVNRTEYQRQWRAKNPEKEAANRRKDRLRHPYTPRPKPEPDPTGRLISLQQEQIYRLVHPDFYNLPYWAAGKLLGVCTATICNELKRIKKVCPTLFPLYPPLPKSMTSGINRPAVRYENWMDCKIVEKF